MLQKVWSKLLQLKWEVLPYPEYSPDMAPSDYHFFRLMQHALTDTHFSSYDEFQKWMNGLPRKTTRSISVEVPCCRRDGKSSRNWRKLLWLRYDSPSLRNKSILETKKRRELSLIYYVNISTSDFEFSLVPKLQNRFSLSIRISFFVHGQVNKTQVN